jgi:hypothetical protein
MTVSSTLTTTRRGLSAAWPDPDTSTLAGEHALLLRDVRRRAAPVIALTHARTWPTAELRTLVGHLRSTVLRQASDEEVLLYPNGSSAPFAELNADHVRLHALTDELDQADSATCSLAQLHRLIDELLAVLERHLIEEQAVLAALPDTPPEVPSAAELAAGTKAWFPPDDQPVLIALDTLPRERAVQLCIERLLRLRPGETAEITSAYPTELTRVREWVRAFDSTRYGTARADGEDGRSGLLVTRRHAV